MTAPEESEGSHRGSTASLRVAEIHIDDSRVGTGFFVTENLVLTAAHVISDAKRMAVRPNGTSGWTEAAPVWRSQDQDVVLLRTATNLRVSPEWKPLTWADVRPGAVVLMTRLRSPLTEPGPRPTPVEYWALLVNVSRRAEQLELEVTNADADSVADLDGAAVVSQNGELVAVVTTSASSDPGGSHRRRGPVLKAVAASILLTDSEMAALVGQDQDAIRPILPTVKIQPLAAILVPALRQPHTGDLSLSVARLLHPRIALVPFIDRSDEVASLLQWCHSSDPAAVAVVAGPGGIGKTRLAMELCGRLSEQGWDAGFVNIAAIDEVQRSTRRPTLAVVDYAETLPPQQLAQMSNGQSDSPVRLVLLTRSPGGWLDEFQTLLSRRRARVPTRVWTLPNLPRAAMEDLARHAALALSSRLRQPTPTEPANSLNSSIRTPLDVQLSILVNYLTTASGDQGGRDLRAAAAEAIVQRWIDLGPQPLPSREWAIRTLALTALIRPAEADLSALLSSAGLLSQASQTSPAEVTAWLKAVFGGDTEFDAYLPDPLLAQLIRLDKGRQAVFDAALAWATQRPVAALTVLASLSRLVDEGSLRAPAVFGLRQHFEPLARLAVTTTEPDVAVVLSACVNAIEATGAKAPISQWRAMIRQARGLGHLGFAGMGDRFTRFDRLKRTPLIDGIVDLLQAPAERAPGDAAAPPKDGGGGTDNDPATGVTAGVADGEDASGPSVIAIDGPWGAGKTSLMRIVQTRLDTAGTLSPTRPQRLKAWLARQWRARRMTVLEALLRLLLWREQPSAGTSGERAPTRRVITVWFDPWSHQSSEQVWAGLARAILDAVQPRLCPTANEKARYWLGRNASRLDRGALRRTLLRRVQSPLLRLGVFALIPPIVAALLRYDKTFHLFGRDRSATLVAVVLALGALLLALVHTLFRLVIGNVIAYCPPGLLDTPVLSGVVAEGTVEAGIRDPLYHARSGYLYLHQHDIHQLLADAERGGMAVVVFIDDLDRCSPQTTAEVLGAVNLFLSEAFPAARFVIGLDTAVVASHIDQSMKNYVNNGSSLYAGDPSPGWTFLRKLVQLPITLPRVPLETLEELLADYLGKEQWDLDEKRADAAVTSLDVAVGDAGRDQRRRPAPSASPAPDPISPQATSLPNAAQTEAITALATVTRLEQNPEVRQCIRDRLASWSNPSVREAKRLLTVWQFYIRVLSHPDSTTGRLAGIEEVRRAQAAVLLAEIVVRWPAYLNKLMAISGERQALGHLVDAADSDDLTWARTIAKVGFDQAKDCRAVDALREVLRDTYAGQAADLAEALF